MIGVDQLSRSYHFLGSGGYAESTERERVSMVGPQPSRRTGDAMLKSLEGVLALGSTLVTFLLGSEGEPAANTTQIGPWFDPLG
jgi:hypothetical protein